MLRTGSRFTPRTGRSDSAGGFAKERGKAWIIRDMTSLCGGLHNEVMSLYFFSSFQENRACRRFISFRNYENTIGIMVQHRLHNLVPALNRSGCSIRRTAGMTYDGWFALYSKSRTSPSSRRGSLCCTPNDLKPGPSCEACAATRSISTTSYCTPYNSWRKRNPETLKEIKRRFV